MRPNVDIPWSIHGEIKHYAETQDITIEDAYIEALSEGIEELPIPKNPDQVSFSEDEEWLGFGPREVHSTGTESVDINNVTTCFSDFYLPNQGMKIATARQSLTPEKLVSHLASLDSTVSITDDWFTLHQIGGSWVGRGLSNLADTVEAASDLFSGADFDQYGHAVLTYIGELPRESEYIFLRGEISRQNGNISSFTLRFLTEGYPITGKNYRKIANSLGFTELFNAREFTFNRASLRLDDPLEVTVNSRVPRDSRYDDPYVGGLFIENPFQKFDGLEDALDWKSPDDVPNRHQAEVALDHLAQYDELYTELPDHHPVSEEREYTMRGLSVTYLSPIFKRNSMWNIDLDVNW